MELLGRVSQDEVVAAWLAAEINSSRFAAQIEALLARDGRDNSVIRDPDLDSAAQNAYRLRLLGEYRGFGRAAGEGSIWLEGREVGDLDWWRVRLSRADLGHVRFTNGEF